jgi:hypothetical protein
VVNGVGWKVVCVHVDVKNVMKRSRSFWVIFHLVCLCGIVAPVTRCVSGIVGGGGSCSVGLCAM